MQKITLFFAFLITLALSTVVIIFFDDEKNNIKALPEELYQVYLEGEKIGVIASKDKFEAYIDNEQKEIKDKYKVNNVYPPKNLSIQKVISYTDNIIKEEEVYDLIKEKNPFTIKGYVITIKGDKTRVINVIDKELFTDAITKTVEAFIPRDDYMKFINEEQKEIEGIGKLIEDLYINQDITIKETYISTDEEIFTSGNLLAKYLLFGTLDEQHKYIVKDGDTIEKISFDHKLGAEEFLIVNPEFSNANSLLFPGQEVSVGLIEPLIDVVVEEHVVEDQIIAYDTEEEYDNTLAYGTSKVKQEGSNGIERVILKRQTTNGVITNVQIDRSSSYTVKEPVTKIVVKGTKSTSGETITISPDGKWVWPTNIPYVITSTYGYRWGSMHAAIDISGTGYGSPIKAARAGTVLTSSYDRTRGNYIVLAHDNNYYTIYLHLSKKFVSEGQTVKAGQIIAGMGNSGNVRGVTGTHLHFGIHVGEPYTSETRTINPVTVYK